MNILVCVCIFRTSLLKIINESVLFPFCMFMRTTRKRHVWQKRQNLTYPNYPFIVLSIQSISLERWLTHFLNLHSMIFCSVCAHFPDFVCFIHQCKMHIQIMFYVKYAFIHIFEGTHSTNTVPTHCIIQSIAVTLNRIRGKQELNWCSLGKAISFVNNL